MLLRALIAATLVLAPSLAQAATADLSVRAADISFSKSTLVSGDVVRLYAKVKNVGDQDVSGYVSFFQGAMPVDDSQVISVRAGGVPEEVYVDFTVPDGSFNIRAEIRGTSPADTNAGNDVAITGLFTPVQDGDRDGVEDGKDNCPADKNADQKDTDSDGQGNACDGDDDADGLSDEVEQEIGTSPVRKDTDGDGVNDKDDAYPTDPGKSVVPPPTPAPAPAPKPAPATTPVLIPEPAEAVPPSETPAEQLEPASEPADEAQEGMPAAFTVRRVGWDKFAFSALSPAEVGYRFAWDFGDGVTSNRHSLEHSYGRAGSFEAKLVVTDPEDRETADKAVVHVPLMNLGNPWVKLAVSALSLLLLSGLLAFLRMALARRRSGEIARALDAAPLPKEVSEGPAPWIPEPGQPKGPRKVRVRTE